jgi:prepilin-type N-terminal cleavage/methylation domain-containing protein
MSHNQLKHLGQKGFTIIELLIATLIFTLVLILVTTGVLQFTRQYYKGVISSNTQSTARGIIDDITRTIQFNSGSLYLLKSTTLTPNNDPSAQPLGFCIGETKRFSFKINAQVTEGSAFASQHQSNHGLITDGVSGCSTATPALDVTNPTILTNPDIQTGRTLQNAREHLGQRMRLSKFKIEPVANMFNTYTVTVRIIYGDDDLLCTPTIPDSCVDRNTTPDPKSDAESLICKSTVGSHFCAVSELSTTVKKRVD